MKEDEIKKEHSHKDKNGNTRLCGLPIVPDRQLEYTINPYVESLIRYIEKKWVNHTLLHYHFLESSQAWVGAESQKQVVRALTGERSN